MQPYNVQGQLLHLNLLFLQNAVDIALQQSREYLHLFTALPFQILSKQFFNHMLQQRIHQIALWPTAYRIK